MSVDAAFDWRASPQQQARHWERKLDLLLRLEAEALAERLCAGADQAHEAGAPQRRLVEK